MDQSKLTRVLPPVPRALVSRRVSECGLIKRTIPHDHLIPDCRHQRHRHQPSRNYA